MTLNVTTAKEVKAQSPAPYSEEDNSIRHFYAKFSVSAKYHRLTKNKHRFEIAIRLKSAVKGERLPYIHMTEIYRQREIAGIKLSAVSAQLTGFDESGNLRFVIGDKLMVTVPAKSTDQVHQAS